MNIAGIVGCVKPVRGMLKMSDRLTEVHGKKRLRLTNAGPTDNVKKWVAVLVQTLFFKWSGVLFSSCHADPWTSTPHLDQ